MLKSKRAKILSVVGALALIMVISGFALTRGYLMRFVVNDEQISRDAYFEMVERINQTNGSMYCAPEWRLGLVYFYEVQCFDTMEALNEYMEVRHPE